MGMVAADADDAFSAIYRSWLDYSSDLQYVLLQSTRNSESGVLVAGSSVGPGSRRASPGHRFGRVRSGYMAEGSSEEN
ncbi:hypothetical protein VI817_006410 [Penicillium citrinum]|nr:hypothetical protein VI817_006410 [Penicillium citrinum]